MASKTTPLLSGKMLLPALLQLCSFSARPRVVPCRAALGNWPWRLASCLYFFWIFCVVLLLVVALPCALIRWCFSLAVLRAKMSLLEMGGGGGGGLKSAVISPKVFWSWRPRLVRQCRFHSAGSCLYCIVPWNSSAAVLLALILYQGKDLDWISSFKHMSKGWCS